MQTVRLDVSVYEGVRSFEFRFLVLPGHVDPETEVVRAEAETYVVVEKIGAAAQAVEETVSDLRDGA